MSAGGPHALRPGAVVGGHTLERLLGEGASGSVYVARPAVGAPRALKVVAGRGRPDRLERFAREGRTLARLPRHAGVVVVHEAGVEGELAWCALELVEGVDLERLLAAGPLSPRRAARIGRDLAGGLAHLHAHGVVHRDLKPANVLLRAADDAPVIVDLGIARDEAEARMTRSQAVLGTPAYMSPEQVQGGTRGVSPASDVFALGAVLYEALTGEPAFTGETLLELSARVATTDVPPPSRARPDVPRDLDRVVLACLQKEPGARPTAARVAAALGVVSRGEALARDALRGEAPRRPRAGAPLVAAALAVALAAGLAGALQSRARGRLARAALDDARALVLGRVAPWLAAEAGVGSGDRAGPAALASEAAVARAALLEARAALDAGGAAEADGLAEWLDAPRALAAGRDDRRRAAPAGVPRPAEAAVDALLALAEGDRGRAVTSAERAGRGGPLGALVRQAVRATLEPERLLDEAERAAAPGPLDEATRAALPRAVAVQAAVLVRRAAARLALDEAGQELDRLAARARALEVGLTPAREAMRAAIDEALAPAVAAQVEAELRRAEADPLLAADLVRRVADVTRRGPGAGEVGPPLRDALEPLVRGPLEAWRLAGDRSSIAAWRHLGRACVADAALTYELGRASPPALGAALAELVTIDFRSVYTDDRWATLVLHAALRVGVPCPARSLPAPSAPSLRELAARYPRSRAARAALDYVGQERGGKGGSTERLALVALLDEVFAAPVADLAPVYEAELHLRRGELLAVEAASARRRGRADDARALAVRARADLDRADGRLLPVRDLLLTQAEAAAAVCAADDDLEGRVACWARAALRFRARAEAGAPLLLSTPRDELVTAGRALVEQAEGEHRLGRLAAAEAALREAIALGRATASPDGMARGRLCDVLVSAGRLDDARDALAPALDQAREVWEVAAADVRLRRARGDLEGARAALREALTEHRTEELEALRRELGLER